jgi:hypothetical protein
MRISILLFILVIIFLYITRRTEKIENFTDNDYLITINDLEQIFTNSKYESLKRDKDYEEAIYNFKLIHDFCVSLELDLKQKQEILYCNLPPDTPDLCRGENIRM